MDTIRVIKIIKEKAAPYIEFFIVNEPSGFDSIAKKIENFDCTIEQFFSASKQIESWEAEILMSATIHQTLAYQEEIVPIEVARDLAYKFINSLDANVKLYSNCVSDDDVSGIGSWNPLTNNTFESLLYCETNTNSILVYSFDED